MHRHSYEGETEVSFSKVALPPTKGKVLNSPAAELPRARTPRGVIVSRPPNSKGGLEA